MSGVYIPNMKMPESCDVCWAEYAYEICNSHSENCPLVPVPDHGRLIDADEAIAHLFFGEQCLYCWDEIQDAIDATQTIIPAEEEAGE